MRPQCYSVKWPTWLHMLNIKMHVCSFVQADISYALWKLTNSCGLHISNSVCQCATQMGGVSLLSLLSGSVYYKESQSPRCHYDVMFKWVVGCIWSFHPGDWGLYSVVGFFLIYLLLFFNNHFIFLVLLGWLGTTNTYLGWANKTTWLGLGTKLGVITITFLGESLQS